jgi:hypothetical protein
MIRRAEPGDKAAVLRMARDFHAASGTALPYSAATASMLFDACLAGGDRLCLVLDVDGAHGTLVAQAGPHHFSPVRIATEIIWWVDPDYRGIDAMRFLPAYEAWARERGCQFASMVGLGSDPAVGRLYELRRYVPAERHYLKTL